MRGSEFRLLVINPGATSTKLAVFRNETPEWVRTLSHSDEEMREYRGRPVLEQLGATRGGGAPGT